MGMRNKALCEALARWSGTRPEDWYPVFKARYGMEVAFEAIRRRQGDGSVLTQLFTCSTAVDPIIAAGLAPCYADVDRDTLSIDMRSLPSSEDNATRVVMLQHTFGIVDDASSRAIADAAHGMNALVMEDCAHCVTRLARDGRTGNPLADISVHSFGVEKILPTRFGGAIWINPSLSRTHPRLDAELRTRLDELPTPGVRLDMVTRLYVNQNRVFSRLGGLGAALRKACAGIGWYEPPIADCEREGRLAYPAYGVTPWIADRAVRALEDLDANESGRKAVVELYRNALAGAKGLYLPESVVRGDAQPLLRFPVLAADTDMAERLIAAVRRTGALAERWYRPELFPGATNEAAYGLDRLDRGTVRVSDELASRVLVLPTELSEGRARTVVRALLD